MLLILVISSDDDIVEQVKQTFPEDSDNDDDGDEYPSELDQIPKPGEVADCGLPKTRKPTFKRRRKRERR